VEESLCDGTGNAVSATVLRCRQHGDSRGLQLYLQSRIGYRIALLKRRWFVEPSVAFNYWPINTNLPARFGAVERGAPNYFLFEPGLHFGFTF
jgi:hypothetical protein